MTPRKEVASQKELADMEDDAPIDTHKGLTEEKSRVNLLARPGTLQDEEVSIAHHIPTLDEH